MSDRADEIMRLLEQAHPDAHCELNYRSDFELLVAVILSAQCTDRRVNLVTKELFASYNKPEDFASMPQEKLEKLIHSCGFFRAKARSIISASTDIIERFGGKVPSTMEELLTMRGVGRKTANVVLSVAFGESTQARAFGQADSGGRGKRSYGGNKRGYALKSAPFAYFPR